MKASEFDIECLARAWAVLDGRGNLFDDCKIDPDLEEELGHYEGYLSDASELINQYIKELSRESK